MSDDSQVMKQLTQQARQLRYARMLPTDTPLTEEQISLIRGDYIRHTNNHGIFDAQVAKQVSLSQSTISLFKNGQYTGDNESVARKLNDWFELDMERREAALPTDYVQTHICEEIRSICEITRRDCVMAAIVAPSGCGKTMMMEVLAEQFLGRVIYCHEYLTPKKFAQAVAAAFSVSQHGATADVITSIVEKLRGTNRPLFLDEAHTLRQPVFGVIRTIHDQARVPVIMMGARGILDRVDDRRDGAGQFARRTRQYNAIERAHNVEDPTRGGKKIGRPLFSKDEIKRFLDKLSIKLADDQAFELAWSVACLVNHGTLGLLRQIVLTVRGSERSRAKPISRREIIDCLGLLYGMRGGYVVQQADIHAAELGVRGVA